MDAILSPIGGRWKAVPVRYLLDGYKRVGAEEKQRGPPIML